MKVYIADILKSDGASLDLEFNDKLDELNSIDPGYEFNAPIAFKGRLVNISKVLKLDGSLKTEYSVKCYRCLKDISCSIDIIIKEDFVNAETNEGTEAYTYEGNYIDLGRVLEDNIILNLPMKQVCSEDCKGLCPVCGNDLNVSECGCKGETIDPRMEILKNLFNS